jgi:hypothetical protein
MSTNSSQKRKNIIVPQSAFGGCLWKMPDGGFISDADDNYMCAEGMIGDRRVEAQMAEAARYWAGDGNGGKPHWVDGARKVSDSEREEQEGRLSEGLMPDPVEDAIIEVAPYKGKIR